MEILGAVSELLSVFVFLYVVLRLGAKVDRLEGQQRVLAGEIAHLRGRIEDMIKNQNRLDRPKP